MGVSCTQLHMFNHFYVANKSRESGTSAYSNHYAFVCQYIAICNILIFSIGLYCIAVVNIAIYQYIVSPLLDTGGMGC